MKSAEIKIIELNVPVGTIVAWYSVSGRLPEGWAICNGDNGTPNLVGKFIRGVGTLSEIGLDPNAKETHTHILDYPYQTTTDQGNDSVKVIWLRNVDQAVTAPASHIPPNFRLVYIMKVSD